MAALREASDKIAALIREKEIDGEKVTLERNVEQLVGELEAAIHEADVFIARLQQG